MNQNYQLCSPWCVWLGFIIPESQSTKADYTDRLKRLHVFKTYYDLIYYWRESKFRNVHQFFVYDQDPTHNNLTSYQIDGKIKTINAINYFKEGILPTWEDENNKNGGRLIFQIDKEIEKYQEIYEWLIFYFLGESEPSSDDITGIRFISHKPNSYFKFHYRVEVWTKFNSTETEKAQNLKNTFVKDFFSSFLSDNPNLKKNFFPSFKDNRDDKAEKQVKEKKEDEQKPKA